jgi:hypothetical protein
MPGAGAATLSAGYPALGTTVGVTILSPTASTAYLFWSIGVNPAGSPVIAGGSCLHYLDSPTLAALAAVGAEPLASVYTGPPLGSFWVSINFGWFPVPANPSFAGIVIGLQAIVVGSSGSIPLGPGSFAQTSNALQATLGYGY